MVDSAANVNSRVWQVGALCQAAADILDARFNPVTVVGELSGFTRAASGHCYFSIKDERSQLRCAMFRRAASLLEFTPRDGDRVQVRGRLGVYEPRGDLQLVAETMTRAGAGALLEQFLLLKAKLEALGLFDTARKRAIPAFARGIGVVTSLGAAALRDVASTLQRRVPHIPVTLAPAQVQGAAAAAEVVRALSALYGLCQTHGTHPKIDVILLVRGGGSIEDLWTFNDEAVVRCVAASPVPVITGIGHETDFTLVDFAADLRAATPTAAAELAALAREDLWAGLTAFQERARSAVHRGVDRLAQRQDLAAARLARPLDGVLRARADCAQWQYRLQRQVSLRIASAAQDLQWREAAWRAAVLAQSRHAAQTLERWSLRVAALDPDLVLKRGYALLTDENGAVITQAADTHPGQRLKASLADGRVDLRVVGRCHE